jgi:ribonuclease HI
MLQAWRCMLATYDSANICAFHRLQRRFRRTTRQARRAFTNALLESDPYTLSALERRATRVETHRLRRPDGTFTATPDEHLATLIQHIFSSARDATEDTPAAAPTAEPALPDELEWDWITLKEVHEATQDTLAGKAPGKDGLPAEVYKATLDSLAPLLRHLFNTSLRLGYMPSEWLRAVVLMLPKPARPDYEDPAAFRPISLLPVIAKILDRIMSTRVSGLLEYYHLLPDGIYGFRARRSAPQGVAAALRSAQARRLSPTDRYVAILKTDVKGAYNNSLPSRILAACRRLRFPQQLRIWLGAWLQRRTIECTFPLAAPSVQTLDIGLPQGSNLSPILFALLGIDLPALLHSVGVHATLYADDNLLVASGDSRALAVASLRRAARVLRAGWLLPNALTLDLAKSEVLHLWGNDRLADIPALTIDGVLIPKVEHMRALGIILDRRLTFTAHREHAAALGFRCYHYLRTLVDNSYGASCDALLRLYRSWLCPKVFYGVEVWGESALRSVAAVRPLVRLQRWVALAALGVRRTASTVYLDSDCELPSVQQRVSWLLGRGFVRNRSSLLEHLPALSTPATVSAALGLPLSQCGWISLLSPHTRLILPWRLASLAQLHTRLVIDPAPAALASAAAAHANPTPQLLAYCDGSYADGASGCGIWVQHPARVAAVEFSLPLAAPNTSYGAEMAGLYHSLATMLQVAEAGRVSGTTQGPNPRLPLSATLFCDSEGALKAVARGHTRPMYLVDGLVDRIRCLLGALGARFPAGLTLQWVPSHCGLWGNERVDTLAQEAVSRLRTRPVPLSVHVEFEFGGRGLGPPLLLPDPSAALRVLRDLLNGVRDDALAAYRERAPVPALPAGEAATPGAGGPSGGLGAGGAADRAAGGMAAGPDLGDDLWAPASGSPAEELEAEAAADAASWAAPSAPASDEEVAEAGGRGGQRALGWFHPLADRRLIRSYVAHVRSGLTRAEATLVSRLRSGHGIGRAYWHALGAAPSPTCPRCGLFPETPAHRLYAGCPALAAEQRALRLAAFGSAAADGPLTASRAQHLLGTPRGVAALLHFWRRTHTPLDRRPPV